MALQVWLPLNGNLDNQGVSSLVPVRSTAPTYVNGKTGKAMSTGAMYLPAAEVAKFYNNNAMSFCFWIYPTASGSAATPIIGQSAMAAGDNRMFTIYHYSTTADIHLSWQNETSAGTFLNVVWSNVLTVTAWNHVAITYNGSTAILYVNGVQKGTASGTSARTNFAYNVPIPSSTQRYLCDLRIYDHCLTPKEVKEISKGLIVHYKLDDPYAAKTLVINGFGELGSENWSNSNLISTTEKPSADASIKASTYNGNQTITNILVNNNSTYTISAYIKSSGATSGTTYPSIFPIDADGKMIMTYNCADGFGTSYRTTLAKPLKKGDTVIYATDLSAWTTANNNYYYHVAIFGYKDSFGRLYPDMGYTADSPVFGSYSDKSHINKTNNTITLNAAYTGEDRQAGTVICQATEGGTYIYPFGGIALNTLSDWTFKTATLSGSINRLKYAKYMRWYDYSNIYVAGLTIKDNSWSTTTVTDSSGFKYNGIVNGSVTNSINTSRFSLSTVFNNSGHVILSAFNVTMNAFTINMWIKPKAMTTSQHFLFGTFTSWTGHGIGIWRDSGAPTKFNCLVKSDAASSYSNKPVYLTLDTWSMLTLLYNGTNIIAYVNGSQYYTDNYGSNGTVTNPNLMLCNSKYNSTAASENEEAYISDFRLYTTALSADDIKELYQTSAHIDKNGNNYAYEFVEV